ncbi:MAG: ATP-binding cassette domain-containing protein [Candidatus Bipolaricaulota bacterium]|nr:ATP-binding cassette domain-containing protein [Candidatus Bipolaricaulota bacterium]
MFRTRKREAKKQKREVVALDGISFEVPRGELFGVLGPNGAGKTTTIKILATLLTPTSGRAWVAGIDVAADPNGVRHHIGMVSGGETSGYGLLTVEENLWMFSQFYGWRRGRLAPESATFWRSSDSAIGRGRRSTTCRPG